MSGCWSNTMGQKIERREITAQEIQFASDCHRDLLNTIRRVLHEAKCPGDYPFFDLQRVYDLMQKHGVLSVIQKIYSMSGEGIDVPQLDIEELECAMEGGKQ
jgi:hypothetical protein